MMTEEHQLFRSSLRTFLEQEVRPYIDEWEAAGAVPRSIYERFGDMGYLGLALPERYGGLELDIWYQVIFNEELCRMNSGGFQAAIGAHALLAMTHINAEGNDQQKEAYLIPGIAGKRIGALAVTEPGGGSDVQAIRSRAVRVGEEYLINGSKTFITNGVSSDYLLVAAQLEEGGRAKGLTMFLVERERSGLSATPLKKLGWRASDTGEIALQDVRIPVTNLLGEPGHGFLYIMQHFVSERLSMGLSGVANAAYALELTLQYMHERTAFGRSLTKFQELRHRVAQMSAEIECYRQFIYQVYQTFEEGAYPVKEASMAKLLGTQLNDRVATQCLQLFGGYGFMEEYPLARMYRDTRLGQIGGGTSEIMCEIIARSVVDKKLYG